MLFSQNDSFLQTKPAHPAGFVIKSHQIHMDYALWLFFFILYSFLGWIGDTLTRSLTAHRYLPGSFFPIPLCPLYGFGALLAIGLSPLITRLPLILEGAAYGVILAALECITGIIILKRFHRRLWLYKPSLLNIAGFTDLAHAMLWGLLALVFLYIGHPWVENMVRQSLVRT